MVGLFENLGGLFKTSEQADAEADAGPSAMELAMQAAIERHAADKASAAGLQVPEGTDERLLKTKAAGAVFGRRASAENQTVEFRAVE